MDSLITKSLLSFQAEGIAAAGLGGTPLSNVSHERGILRLALDLAFRHANVVYSPGKLWHFKKKFNPEWLPVYFAATTRCFSGARVLGNREGFASLR